MERRSLLIGALAFCALPVRRAWAIPSRVFGLYRYGGGQKQRERFEAAVEDVVSELNIVIRGIARKKITESQTPAVRIELAKEGDMVVIRRDGAPEIRGRADGKRFKWKNRYGDELRLRMKLDEKQLELRFEGTSDRTVTTYTVDDAGHLKLRTVITDPRLPKPLKLTFTYKPVQG